MAVTSSRVIIPWSINPAAAERPLSSSETSILAMGNSSLTLITWPVCTCVHNRGTEALDAVEDDGVGHPELMCAQSRPPRACDSRIRDPRMWIVIRTAGKVVCIRLANFRF